MNELQQGRVVETHHNEQAPLTKTLDNAVEFQQAKEIKESEILEYEETPYENEVEQLTNVGKPNWLARTFFISLFILLVAEVFIALTSLIHSSPILAGVYGLAVLSALSIIGKVLFREFRLLQKLKTTKHQQEQSERLLNSVQIGEAELFLQKITSETHKEPLAKMLKQIEPHHTDSEIMALYSKTVLKQQDQKAQAIIKQYATTSGLMVAISPIALVDMAVVLWRSTKMIEEITRVYGLPLGYVSRIRLYRMTFRQMLFAGSAELVSDFATTALSAELTGKLSTRAAQGVSISILTARIGAKAIEVSRPIKGLPNKQNLLKHCLDLALKKVQ